MTEKKQLKEYHKAGNEGYGMVQIFKITDTEKPGAVKFKLQYDSKFKRITWIEKEYDDYKDAYKDFDHYVKHIVKITKNKEEKKTMYFIRTAFENNEILVKKEYYVDFIERLKALGIEWYEYESEGKDYKYKTLLPKQNEYTQYEQNKD